MRIIPGTHSRQQIPLWQTLLAQAITRPEDLLQRLELPLDLLPASLKASRQFRLRVPLGFADLMRKGDPDDPLLRQVLPLAEELQQTPGYSNDPLDELNAMPVPGALHKYQGRLLLTATGACAVHCRYCFRRHYPYSEANPGREPRQTLDYLRAHPDINEVILSGGDPLTLSDNRLAGWVQQLEGLPQVTRLRIHSRVPVVLPARVDAGLLDWIEKSRLKVVMVIHANHANEISPEVTRALAALSAAGARLLNQSVLLRGVNDSVAALSNLSEALFTAGVQPYYLHQLDPVSGAGHFEVSDEEAKFLIKQLTNTQSGYLVPKLVRETPGHKSKSLV